MLDGVIYKIEICNEIYIGSTTELLIERQRKHNYELKNKTIKLYETCKVNNINKITLIEIEKVKVNNKKELKIIEQDYINKLKPTLNMCRAYRTEEELKEHQKEYDKNRPNKKERYDQKKIYYQQNKEKIKENVKKNSKIKVNCEFCEKEITKGYLTKHKKICNKINN